MYISRCFGLQNLSPVATRAPHLDVRARIVAEATDALLQPNLTPRAPKRSIKPASKKTRPHHGKHRCGFVPTLRTIPEEPAMPLPPTPAQTARVAAVMLALPRAAPKIAPLMVPAQVHLAPARAAHHKAPILCTVLRLEITWRPNEA